MVSDMYQKPVKRFIKMTDGCAAQFWGYGSYCSLELLCQQFPDLKTCQFNRYASGEGKNLSDAIGSMLKSAMRRGVLKKRNMINDDNLEMGVELGDIEFDTYAGFMDWFKNLIPKTTLKFKRFLVVEVDTGLISEKKDLVVEGDVTKMVGMKKMHCTLYNAQSRKLYFRQSTCSCYSCNAAMYEECTFSANHGPWIEHDLHAPKSKSKGKKNVVEESDIESDGFCEEEDSENDEEVIDLGQSDPQCPVQEHFVSCVEMNTSWIPGDYFIVNIMEKHYCAVLLDAGDDSLTFRCMRRDMGYSEISSQVRFVEKAGDDLVIVPLNPESVNSDLSQDSNEVPRGVLKARVSVYKLGRRGGLLISRDIFKKFNGI